jgi:D-hydroxyproline dehydrogenase subunit beta
MFDVAIVGAGILGLAHAYHLARAGKKVVVFERSRQAEGASIRNFGMLWPIGQPLGERYELALRSREHWLALLADAKIGHEQTGSLHLAYAEDEAAVLQEIAFPQAQWIEPAQVHQRAQGIRPESLRGALWSPTEVCVDPREIIASLPAFLTERYGVTFHFSTTVFGYDHPRVTTSAGAFDAARLLVCSGHELATLYPEVLAAETELSVCKLQMMRTFPQPRSWRLGPMLAAGLTLAHYEAFKSCPSLPALKARLHQEYADYEHYGIHVLVSQNGQGELTLGDSHEYDSAISIFNNEQIDTLVLRYLATFLQAPTCQIASRWHGFYLKHKSQPWWIAHPEENVTLVTGIGGAGMTLSFGLAEKVVESF